MSHSNQCNVAILLATYNGARFIEEQLRSYLRNDTSFALHWLDDHSSDDTREVVRSVTAALGIELHEWHQPAHVGYPATFYKLLDSVAADIYMFSDQDDIWQSGKIDATVADLSRDVTAPVLCFSDPLVFFDDDPDTFYPLSEVRRLPAPASLRASRALMSLPAAGQSMGITHGLRELYLRHKEIAQTYSFGHSWWLYLLASSVGEVRMLTDSPRTLWRQHGGNVTSPFFARNRTLKEQMASEWRAQQLFRPGMARQAQGFLLASDTLPADPRLDRLRSLAPIVSRIDHRQSPFALARLLLHRAMWPDWRTQFWIMLTCLFSTATTVDQASSRRRRLSEA